MLSLLFTQSFLVSLWTNKESVWHALDEREFHWSTGTKLLFCLLSNSVAKSGIIDFILPDRPFFNSIHQSYVGLKVLISLLDSRYARYLCSSLENRNPWDSKKAGRQNQYKYVGYTGQDVAVYFTADFPISTQPNTSHPFTWIFTTNLFLRT